MTRNEVLEKCVQEQVLVRDRTPEGEEPVLHKPVDDRILVVQEGGHDEEAGNE